MIHDSPSPTLTTGQAAAAIGLSQQTIIRMCNKPDGGLPCHRVGRHRRICLDDLIALMESRQCSANHIERVQARFRKHGTDSEPSVTQPPALLTTGQAATLCGVSDALIQRVCDDGELRCARIARHRRIHVDDLIAWMGECGYPPTMIERVQRTFTPAASVDDAICRVSDAMHILRMPRQAIRSMCRSGVLRARKIRGIWHVDRSDVQRMADAMTDHVLKGKAMPKPTTKGATQ